MADCVRALCGLGAKTSDLREKMKKLSQLTHALDFYQRKNLVRQFREEEIMESEMRILAKTRKRQLKWGAEALVLLSLCGSIIWAACA